MEQLWSPDQWLGTFAVGSNLEEQTQGSKKFCMVGLGTKKGGKVNKSKFNLISSAKQDKFEAGFITLRHGVKNIC